MKYVATTNTITVSGTSEKDFFLFTNPSNSGVKALIFVTDIEHDGLSSKLARMRMYRDPTITDNGTAVTVNNLVKSETGSVVDIFHTPTISSRGTQLTTTAYHFQQSPFRPDVNICVEENESLLFTVHPSSSNDDHCLTLYWYEE